ncbi:Hint domain-containing protein [Pseudooceanicola sp. LIPI14-2-Ac024]|uniref:Hint domain-containing protein n=1 Tax=Pseudooceanicola sp. LIPI14-2-Ac024 TaxID=3344875 RepID=UPI0035CF3A3E
MQHDHFPITGLGPGTMLLATTGEIPVEWLAPGDRLITRDHGAQEVLHIVRLRRMPSGRALPPPIVFLPGEYGPGGKLSEKLRVAPGTRGLVKRAECELDFGTDEVLARFGDLTRRDEPRRDPTMGPLSYHLVVMRHHEIINAGSLWVESVDSEMAETLDLPDAVTRSTALFDTDARAPRRCLTRDEALLLRGRVPAELSLLDLLAA